MPLTSRPAKPASVAVNLAKSAAQTAALWLVCFILLPAAIRRFEDVTGVSVTRFDPRGLRPLSVITFFTAALIGFWAAFSLVTRGEGTPMPLACTHRFVVTGPYRFIRNPMATMGILQGVAVAVFLGSPLTVLYALAGAVVWQTLMRPWEERDLLERFGEEYRHYCLNVPCWRLRLAPYNATHSA